MDSIAGFGMKWTARTLVDKYRPHIAALSTVVFRPNPEARYLTRLVRSDCDLFHLGHCALSFFLIMQNVFYITFSAPVLHSVFLHLQRRKIGDARTKNRLPSDLCGHFEETKRSADKNDLHNRMRFAAVGSLIPTEARLPKA